MEQALIVALLFVVLCALGGLAGHLMYLRDKRKDMRRRWENEHRLPDALEQYKRAKRAMESPIPKAKRGRDEEYVGA